MDNTKNISAVNKNSEVNPTKDLPVVKPVTSAPQAGSQQNTTNATSVQTQPPQTVTELRNNVMKQDGVVYSSNPFSASQEAPTGQPTTPIFRQAPIAQAPIVQVPIAETMVTQAPVMPTPRPSNQNYEERPHVVSERIIHEKTIIREKSRGRGCGLFSCRKISTCGCLLPILVLFLCGALVYFKPTVIWEPVKTFLNGDANANDLTRMSEVKKLDSPESFPLVEKLSSIMKADPNQSGKFLLSSSKIELKQADLAELLKPVLTNQENVYLGIKESKVQLYLNLDQTGAPLWGIFIFKLDNGQLRIEKMGLGRVSLPEETTKSVESAVLNALGAANIANTSELFTTTIADQPVKIKSTTLDQDKLILEFELKF